MVVLLSIFGIPLESSYNMAFPLFNTYFLIAIKLTVRARQMSASTFLSSIGSLFVKRGEKTVIEHLANELIAIDHLLGETAKVQETPIEKSIKQQVVFNKLLGDLHSFNQSKRR